MMLGKENLTMHGTKRAEKLPVTFFGEKFGMAGYLT